MKSKTLLVHRHLKHERSDTIVVYTVTHGNRATRSRIPNDSIDRPGPTVQKGRWEKPVTQFFPLFFTLGRLTF